MYIYEFEFILHIWSFIKVRVPRPLLHQKVFENFSSLSYNTFLCSRTSIKGLIVNCLTFAILLSSSRWFICIIIVVLSCLSVYIHFYLSDSYVISHVCHNFRSYHYISLTGCQHSFRGACKSQRKTLVVLTCGYAKRTNELLWWLWEMLYLSVDTFVINWIRTMALNIKVRFIVDRSLSKIPWSKFSPLQRACKRPLCWFCWFCSFHRTIRMYLLRGFECFKLVLWPTIITPKSACISLAVLWVLPNIAWKIFPGLHHFQGIHNSTKLQ